MWNRASPRAWAKGREPWEAWLPTAVAVHVHGTRQLGANPQGKGIVMIHEGSSSRSLLRLPELQGCSVSPSALRSPAKVDGLPFVSACLEPTRLE